MNISEKFNKCKDWIKINEKDIFIVLIITLTAFISFGLGRLSSLWDKKIPITVEGASIAGAAMSRESETPTGSLEISTSAQMFVASKNGTKYHFPWCPGARSIKEENKIWFSSAEEAKKSGYVPASNCKGLK